ncbi:tape measure protein [bacterium]|nr:tape measure protein [bacterium]
MSGVEIRVRANTQQARAELAKLEGSVSKIEKVTSGLASSIKAAIGAYSGFVSIKSIVAASDQFLQLENRLKLVAKEGESVQATMAKLNKLALQSRTSLQTTATNYQRLARALDDSSFSSQDFLDVTEAINKATKLGGQPLATQEAALFQLSQAFSSGVLRGEEFNSVSEGAPEILRALTNSLGVTRGELRELAFDGKITSEVLTTALLEQLPEIRREFDLLAPTVAEAGEALKSEFSRALAAIDEIANFSGSTASKFQLLTNAFTYIADNAFIEFNRAKAIFYGFAFDSIMVFRDLQKAITELFSVDFNIDDFKAKIDGFISGVTNSDIYKRLSSIVPSVSVESFVVGTSEVLAKLKGWGEQIKTVFDNMYAYIFGNSPWPDMFNEKGILNPEWQQAMVKFINNILGPFKDSVVNKFDEMFFGVEAGPGKEFRSGGVVNFFKSAIGAIKEFTKELDLAGKAIGAFEASSSFFTSGKDVIRGFTDELARNLDENGGILGYLEKLKASASELSQNLSRDVSDKIFGREEVLPDALGGGYSGRRVGGVLGEQGVADLTTEFVKNNPGKLIGAATVTAIITLLPTELRSNLIQGAFFGLGYVLLAGLAAAATSPIGLVIGAITFGPGILNDLNEFGITREIGRRISSGIVGFFESDAEGQGTFQRVLNAIVATGGEFGAGIVEGIGFQGFKDGLVEKFVGVFALAAIGTAAAGIFRNGWIATGKTIVDLAGSGIEKSKKLYEAFDTLMLDLQTKPNSPLLNKAGTLGTVLGRGMVAGVKGYMAAEGIGLIADSLAGLDGTVTETEQAVSDLLSTSGGMAVAFGQLGMAFGPVGGAIGATVGAAVGAAFTIAQNPELRAAIADMAESVKTLFTEKIPEAFNAALESVKSWAGEVGNELKNAFVQAWDDFKGGIKGFFGFGDGKDNTPMQPPSGLNYTADNIRYQAGGGYISGPGGPTDDKIPAMISNGEYVVRAAAVSKFGRDFLDKINAGVMPRAFAQGSGDPAAMVRLQGQEQSLLSQLAQAQENELIASKEGDNLLQRVARNQKFAAEQALARVYANMAAISDDAVTASGANAGEASKLLGAGTGDDDKTKTLGEQFALDFKNDFRSGLTQALATGDFKTFVEDLADSFTMKVIDSFSAGITEALFGEDGLFAPLFDSIFNWGKGIASKTASTIQDSVTGKGEAGAGIFSKMFKGIGGFFKNLFSGISGLFGGGGGGILSIFGFNSGGIVPSTPYSQAGKDSVPAMLTPGELVVPANRVDQFMNSGGSKQQTVVNLNVTGDISRQTKKEVLKMIPEISAGVNYNNKENNYRR